MQQKLSNTLDLTYENKPVPRPGDLYQTAKPSGRKWYRLWLW